MSLTAKYAAEIILRSFKQRGTGTGEIEMRGALWGDFFRPDGRSGEDFQRGLEYGLEQGLWEPAGAAVRLLQPGTDAIAALGEPHIVVVLRNLGKGVTPTDNPSLYRVGDDLLSLEQMREILPNYEAPED